MSTLPEGTVDFAVITDAKVHNTPKGTMVASLTLVLDKSKTLVFHYVPVPPYTQLLWATDMISAPGLHEMVGKKVHVTLGVSEHNGHVHNTVTSIRRAA